MTKRVKIGLCVVSLATGMTFWLAPAIVGAQLPEREANSQVKAPPPAQAIAKIEAAEPEGRALCLAISPDGGTLAAGCTDGRVYVLGPLSGEKRTRLLCTNRGFVREVAILSDGKTLAALADNKPVQLWDLAAGRVEKSLPALSENKPAGMPQLLANAMAVSADGLIATAGMGIKPNPDGSTDVQSQFFELRVQDESTGEILWSQVGRGGFVNQIAFSPDGTLLAGDFSDEVRLWNARSGRRSQSLKPRQGSLWGVAFSSDGGLLATCGGALVDGKRRVWLTIWELRSGTVVHSFDAGDAAAAVAPRTLAFSPDGQSLASATSRNVTGRISIRGGPTAIGGKVINNVRLWDVKTGTLKWTSPDGDFDQVASLVFSPEGHSVYCCDGTAVSRIDAGTGKSRVDLMKVSAGAGQ